MSMDLMERARKIRDGMMNKVRHFDVKELGEPGKPLRVYVHPLTTEELQRIIEHTDMIERAAMTIDVRARDADGKRMFAMERMDIIKNFPPALILRMARRINSDMEHLTRDEEIIDDAGK